MGGNGTFAAGKIVAYKWKTVDKIDGAKVLEPIGGSRKLPEEAHSSRMYILNNADGTFRQLRVYDSKHRLRFEIGYHREPSVSRALTRKGERCYTTTSSSSPASITARRIRRPMPWCASSGST